MRSFSAERESLDIRRNGNTAAIVGRSRVGAEIHRTRGVWNLQLSMRVVRSGGESGDRWIIADIVAASY